jgi:DNA adenine methylase
VTVIVHAGPPVKWVGGKRQLLPELLKHIPMPAPIECGSAKTHYYEPLVGGGALFFKLRELGFLGSATLGDENERLVRMYMGVRNDVEAVIECLKGMRYDSDEFYETRARLIDTAEDAEVAAWFIYLNRCGFNGLYRVNRKNEFNVPFGKYTNPTICDADGLRRTAAALRKTTFKIGDFEKTVKTAERGDLVYFDPPYVPVNKTSDFTGYTRDGFTFKDQERLRDCALALKRRGVHVVLSNADVPIVRKLYANVFKIHAVSARRNINSKGSARGAVGEVIIT